MRWKRIADEPTTFAVIFEIGEHRIFRSIRVCGSDLVRDQGQAWDCDFGLAQQSVQDAVVIKHAMDEIRVAPHAEFSATFQRSESLLRTPLGAPTFILTLPIVL